MYNEKLKYKEFAMFVTTCTHYNHISGAGFKFKDIFIKTKCKKKITCVIFIKGIAHPKMNSAINYSPHVFPKHRRLTQKRWNCWIKSLFLFAHKKYSRSPVKHWCHMDYFNDALTTFWALNISVALLSMQGQKLSDFIKNILICSKDERRSYE